MVSRLVLGCGTLGNDVVDTLVDGELRVIEPDESRVETLRNQGIDATVGDPTDRAAVAEAGPADLVFVAGDDPAANRAATAAAVAAHPSATVVTYVGTDAGRDQRRDVQRMADEVIDPGAALLDHVDAAMGEDATLGRRLRRAIEAVDGTLGVVTHDNPDPDAIASAMTLVRIAHSLGVPAEVCYYGEIAHQENRALVNLLDYDLRNLDDDDEIDYGGIALVDHSTPGVNDQLPRDASVDVVIDHHPSDRPVDAPFVDLRTDAGATSTLLAGYLRQFGIEPDEDVATGLLYGIRVDTRNFTRETTAADFEAAAYLLPHVAAETVKQIESPSVSGDTFDTIARAIRNRRRHGTALVSCVGTISDRDILSQAADRLLGMEGVETTLVCGFADGTIHLSARTRGADVDIGRVLRDAFGDIGSAGGHADMAGAQIPMGLFSEVETEAEASLSTIIANVVSERFTDAVAASRSGEDGPAGDEGAGDEGAGERTGTGGAAASESGREVETDSAPGADAERDPETE